MAIRALIAKLKRSERGATLVEFAAVFPIFTVMLLGGFDIAYQQYAQSVLDGEVAKAGRDSALETGSAGATQTAIDTKVREAVQSVTPNATVNFTRKSFSSYSRVASPGEPFIDGNANGTCDNGESYEDSNRDGDRDAEGSVTGFSGAKDAIVYTATASYPRIFPMATLVGWNSNVTISSATMLKIQPFNSQAAVPQRTCP